MIGYKTRYIGNPANFDNMKERMEKAFELLKVVMFGFPRSFWFDTFSNKINPYLPLKIHGEMLHTGSYFKKEHEKMVEKVKDALCDVGWIFHKTDNGTLLFHHKSDPFVGIFNDVEPEVTDLGSPGYINNNDESTYVDGITIRQKSFHNFIEVPVCFISIETDIHRQHLPMATLNEAAVESFIGDDSFQLNQFSAQESVLGLAEAKAFFCATIVRMYQEELAKHDYDMKAVGPEYDLIELAKKCDRYLSLDHLDRNNINLTEGESLMRLEEDQY